LPAAPFFLAWPQIATKSSACPNRPFFFRDAPVLRAYIRAVMSTTIDTIRDDFAFLDDWEDRYRYIIELGQGLAPYPEAARDDAHKVQGCVSQVWLKTRLNGGGDPVLEFEGDSDAHIVRGLVAIMLALFSGKRASEILRLDAEGTMHEFGLDEHLTPQRANGLRSMVKRIKREAQAALVPAKAVSE
jgi:cysteine desulfuration protein SufE